VRVVSTSTLAYRFVVTVVFRVIIHLKELDLLSIGKAICCLGWSNVFIGLINQGYRCLHCSALTRE